MLEKIGLPEKPSMRGSAWVVDASHCQGCSSQFSFINRKHHCRRCGGIFCNSCTQQRMVLRGQGDSPVRICDPCKKLADAARFESRFGRQKRTTKESLKLEPKHEDEASNQIPKTDGSHESAAETNGASSSNQMSQAASEMELTSPGELRRKAAEEKSKYKILKGEGKPEEALRAFKRGKELEKQAQALDLALRKNRKKSLASSSYTDAQSKNNSGEGLIDKKEPAKKDDLLSELRDLGWDDGDLNANDQKRENLTLEGELSSIMREVLPNSGAAKVSVSTDNSQVLAHKKKALMLKREGKLAEAKEELKKAKVLERELEEQELLAQAGDASDDELSALIHGLDDYKQDDLPVYGHDPPKNFDLHSLLNDVPLDDHLDVNDDDMNDPAMAATLKSFGWSDEDVPAPSFSSKVSRESEIKHLKKEALKQKQAGNMVEAMELLRNAKQLEKALDSNESEQSSVSLSRTQPEPLMETKDSDLRSKPRPKSKFLIQRELLGVKKKALALRREGRAEEAEEELNKGRDLERQLQEMENTQKIVRSSEKVDDFDKIPNESIVSEEDNVEAVSEVTDCDMDDPTMLSALKDLGWEEEEVASIKVTQSTGLANTPKLFQSKAEIQRELLAVKRKVLALRREGKIQEADEELEKAKPLEEQLQAIEDQNNERQEQKTMKDLQYNVILKNEASQLWDDAAPIKVTQSTGLANTPKIFQSKAEIQRQLLGIKRKALALKREGKIQEADEELEKAKPLEEHIQAIEDQNIERQQQTTTKNLQSENIFKDEARPQRDDAAPIKVTQSTGLANTPKIFQSKAEIQRQLLGIKRKALALKREGKIQEADEELEKAKPLEEQIQAIEDQNIERQQQKTTKDLQSENIFKDEARPQRDDAAPIKVTQSTGLANTPKIFQSKAEIQRELLGIKRKALALKREGKIQEADEELEKAKPLEEQIQAIEDQIVERQQQTTTKDLQSENIFKDEARPQRDDAAPIKVTQSTGLANTPKIFQSKAEIQRELLAIKRKAFALRREGKIQEADEELEKAKPLEEQIQAIEDQIVERLDSKSTKELQSVTISKNKANLEEASPQSGDPMSFPSSSRSENISSLNEIHEKIESLDDQIKARKRKALALKREGKLAEALEELRQAKLIEKSREEDKQSFPVDSSQTRAPMPSSSSSSSMVRPMSSRDRFKLQQEVLSHKRLSLKLKREGRIEESEAEFALAKSLETQLEETVNGNDPKEEGPVLDHLLDPQLVSALKSIGWGDLEIHGKVNASPPKKPEVKMVDPRAELEEQITAEKRRALTLKKAGMQTEALAALRLAKSLEKKLMSL